MKRILIIFLIVPLLSMTVGNKKERFIGKWIGEDQNEIGYLNFDIEGYAYFEFQGQVFGGKEFVFDGKKGKMTYEIHEGTSPIQVDLIVIRLESGEQRKILGIAEFIDDNTMRFALNFNENRPTEFDSEDSLVFKREK